MTHNPVARPAGITTALQLMNDTWPGYLTAKQKILEYITTLEQAQQHTAAVRAQALQELIDNAHGGGNWRRIAEQLKHGSLPAQATGKE